MVIASLIDCPVLALTVSVVIACVDVMSTCIPSKQSAAMGSVTVPVANNGTPVNIMHNVDPNNYNAPGSASNTNTAEYSPACHKVFFQGYKPVLIYQKPPTTKIREWWSDVITLKKVDANEQSKPLHKWQQPQEGFDELVNRFSRPGGLVVDPFAGSGTTGRAAVSQGRHFWGCDIDEECATEKRKLKEMLG